MNNPPLCGPAAEAFESIQGKYGERIIERRIYKGHEYVLFENEETGSWTVILIPDKDWLIVNNMPPDAICMLGGAERGGSPFINGLEAIIPEVDT